MLQVVALLALMLPVHVVVAQTPESPPPAQTTGETTPPAPPDAAPAGPQPIAAADIAPQAEKISSHVREIQKLAESAQATTDITDELSATTQEVTRLARDLAASPPVSLRGVAAARQHWSSLDDLLDGWQASLQKRSTALQEAHDELESSRAVWQVSRSDELPEAVLQQIDSVLSELDATKTAVAQRMEDVLTMQGQVSKQRDSTSRALGRLDEIEASKRSNLLVRDQDPLWRAFASDKRDLASEFARSRSAIRAAVSEFFVRYRTHLAAHAALFVFLVSLIWMTRSAVSDEAMSDRDLERVSVVLSRPISTALLISLLMLRFIYPIAPSEVIQFGRVIALVPLLRLLPKLLPKFYWVFIILAVIYAAESTVQLAEEGSLLQRLMLLATTLLAIIALVAGLLRTYRQEVFEQTRTQHLARVLGWLGVLGLVVSLAANVYGTMALATLLANAMFNAIWAAVVLYVVLNVLSGLLILVLRSPIARVLQSVRNASGIIHRRIVGVLGLGGILIWISLVLSWLQIRQPILRWCEDAIGHEWVVGTLQISVGGVAAFIITIVIAVLLSKLIRFFLEQDVLSRLSLPRGAAATISTLLHYTIMGIGILVALAASGMDLGKLGFIIGALGVGIGFGLQNIVNNFVSGLILIFERPVKVGDLIELTDTKGHVTRIGARSCTVKTFDGAEVIIPNGDLISSSVTNWTLSDQKRRTEVLIPVPRGSDTRRVIDLLQSVARKQEDVLDDPAPVAAFQAFDETGMVLVLRAWPRVDADIVSVRNALVAGSIEALHEAGIDVPRPQRDVHLRQDETAGQQDPAGS
jgi:small-conductance mechanosensitive channel/DNA-binding FrmR family transcriptional regulator